VNNCKLSIVGTCISAVFIIYGILGSTLQFGSLGLVSGLSDFLFVGLAALAVSCALIWVDHAYSPKLVAFQSILLVLSLRVPLFFVQKISISREGYFTGYYEHVLRTSHFGAGSIPYNSFPGFAALMSILTSAMGTTNFGALQQLAYFFPLIIDLAYLLPLGIFLKLLLGQNNRWGMGVWVFYVANITSQDYLSAQAIAYFLFLVLLITLLVNNNKSVRYIVVEIIIISTLAITHTLTALFAVASAGIVYLLRERRLPTIFTYGVLAILAWIMIGAQAISQILPIAVSQESNPSFLLETFGLKALQTLSGGPTIYHDVNRLTVLYMMTFPLLALLSILTGLHSSRLRVWMQSFLTTPLTIFLACLLVSLLVPYPGGERLMRLFLVGMPVAAYYIASVKSRILWVIVVVFLMIAPGFYFVSWTAYQRYEYVPPAESATLSFFYNVVGPSISTVVGDVRYLTYRYQDYYYLIDYQSVLGDGVFGQVNQTVEAPAYYVLTESDFFRFTMSVGDQIRLHQLYSELENSPRYEIIYQSGPGLVAYLPRR